MTLKQWQGISHLIDEPLENLKSQSLELLKDGAGDADLERQSMIAARIAAAKKVKPSTVSEAPARMPFRSKQQQALMRTRSRLEAALREATGGKGLTMLQLTCMHDLEINALSNWSLQDKELLTETQQWKALLKVEIQSNKNQLDALVKKQTWQCEKQAKRKEAREYLRDKKGPSKFCGNTHSVQAPKELVLDMPIGVMWINRQPTAESQEIVKRICDEVPSVQMYKAEGEVAILALTILEEQTSEGASSEERSTKVEMEISFAKATTPSGNSPRPLSSEETTQSRQGGLATTITRIGQHPVGRARGPQACNGHRQRRKPSRWRA